MTTAFHVIHTATLFLLVVYVGHAGAVCAGMERGALRRWAAACLIVPCTLIAIFQLLAMARVFGVVGATGALVLVAGALRWRLGQLGGPSMAALLDHDRMSLARILRPITRGPQGVVTWALLIAACLTVGRTMAYPPLAWDTLTYHAVKPVLWLQSGGALLLEAPGGWSTHAGRLAGADIVAAWAMLAGPGDTVWGAGEVFWWLALAIGLLFLSSELGLRVRERLAVMVYGCFVPTTFLAVGSGYVELAVAATLCLTIGLLSHACRTGAVGAWVVSVCGMAALMSMKLIVWPGVAGLGLFSIFVALRSSDRKSAATIAARAFGVLAAAAIALPGLIRNWANTGYPLSVPLRLGSISLGPPNAELDYLETTFSATASHGLMAEFEALTWSFGNPLRADPQFTVIALPVLALAVCGAARELRRGGAARTRTLWILGVLAAVLAGWFSPSLETARLEWTRANPRHLLPVVVVLLPFAFVSVRGRPVLETATRLWLLAAALLHAWVCIEGFWKYGAYIDATMPASIFLLAVVAWPIFDATRRRARRKALLPPWLFATVAFTTVGCLAWIGCRDFPSRPRFQRIAAQSPFGPVPKYWVESALVLDTPGRPYTIAITSGLQAAADNWFMYPLFGSAHQNHLVHAPVTDSARLLPLAPGHGRTQRARFDIWWEHLTELEADWVMAFQPTTIELRWMQARPDLFEWRKGDRRSWGLFKVKRSDAVDSSPTS